jgi:integrase/recombinase XerD
MKQAKVLSSAELKRLNAVVEGTRHAVRNATAVAFSFYAGLRACEIAALTIGDVFDETGAVRDTVYLSAAQTKGSTGNTVYVNKRLTAALNRYAVAHPKRLLHPSQALIFSAKGAGFTAQTMVNLFAVLYKSAAISGASSHSGRRQFVTELADKAINPRVIQVLARHAHLNTTMRYMDVNDNKLRMAVELVNF